ncbi:hypothetical protein CVV68_05315 [Arthrobacter livingstonensis]|uniref:Uncharacterized protein n=1 Tax=Arthrobacter livingstonensis TaxID=670078 RepID=A0A2V5LBI0_9MICC|nr:hypothetical protein [Arthrobacter livingstonensis]PYI68718.1 hypothetical protein CVV68_05315 [Arthrobacter livingstonensis]
MKQVHLLLAAGVAVSLAGCAPAAVATTPGGPAPSNSAPAESRATATPAAPVIRISPGYAGSGSMTPALEELYALVDDNHEVFSGAWFLGKPSKLVMGVARPDAPAAVQFESLRKQLDPEGRATAVVPAKYSLAEMLGIQKEVLDKYMTKRQNTVQGLGPDPVNEAVNVTILRTASEPPLQENPTVLAIAAKYGNAVEFEETSGVGTLDLAALPAPPHRPAPPESSEMIMFVRPMSDRVGSTDAQDYGESDGGWERPAELPSRSQ